MNALHLMVVVRWAAFALGAYALPGCVARKRLPPWLRAALVAATALTIVSLLRSVATAAHDVGEWDFVCFWLYGHAAAAHHNVYAPATYHALALPMPVDAAFAREVLDVGFPYPPPSIFLFLPLAYLPSFTLASVLWLVVMLAALGAGTAVLAWTYPSDRGSDGMIVITALAVALPAVADNVAYHQTNFFAFAAVAAAYARRRQLGGGIAAALAIIVKPYLVVVMLWLALRRNPSAVAACAVTLAAISLAAVPVLGASAFHTFFTDNPSKRLPAWIYAEPQTASLSAMLIRGAHRHGGAAGPLHDPAYVVIAVIVAAVTFWLTACAAKDDDDLALGLDIALGLMLYPGTGTMYAITLVPALVALGCRARTSMWRAAFMAVAVSFYAGNATGGAATFGAFAAVWFALAATLIVARRRDHFARGFTPMPSGGDRDGTVPASAIPSTAEALIRTSYR